MRRPLRSISPKLASIGPSEGTLEVERPSGVAYRRTCGWRLTPLRRTKSGSLMAVSIVATLEPRDTEKSPW